MNEIPCTVSKRWTQELSCSNFCNRSHTAPKGLASRPRAQRLDHLEMQLRRLNTDTSWLISTQDASIVVDPWLVGEEVDILPSFNTQRLSTRPLLPSDPKSLLHTLDWTAIVITQPFGDHAHEETLKLLDSLHQAPIYAVSTVTKWLRKILPHTRIVEISCKIPTMVESTEIGLVHLSPPILDPTHGAMLLTHKSGSVLYAPHGFKWTAQHKTLDMRKPITLISTTMHYHLPFYLGGPVNLGLQSAKQLYNDIGATEFLETHSDSSKHEQGLVQKLRTITSSSWDDVVREIPGARRPA